jgi:uncharacterized membrane protein HdeD (DUF308 family)
MVKDLLSTGWKMLVVRGLIGIVFGIIAIAWPVDTAIALALLWGFWVLIDGIGSIVQAFQPESKGGRVWLVVFGLISLVAAFFAIFSPAVAAKTLTWILGIWLLVRGVFELVGAFSSTLQMPRWLLLLSAAVSILLGILFVANPGAGAVGIAVWLGIAALVWGIVFVALGLSVRQDLRTAQHATGPGPQPAM